MNSPEVVPLSHCGMNNPLLCLPVVSPGESKITSVGKPRRKQWKEWVIPLLITCGSGDLGWIDINWDSAFPPCRTGRIFRYHCLFFVGKQQPMASRQKVCVFGMSRQSCPPVTWAAHHRHMTLESYSCLAAFDAAAAELLLRQTGFNSVDTEVKLC